MSTCNMLDLQTLGSKPVMPKTLPNDLCGLPILIASGFVYRPKEGAHLIDLFEFGIITDLLH